MAQIRFQNVVKRYGSVTAVDRLSLDVRDREFLVLLGPSGCGKSTTLNMIAGLEDPSEGEIFFDSEVVNFLPPHQRDVAMVFQSYALYPHKSVYENIAFGLRMRRHPEAEIDKRVREAAEVLEIQQLLERRPNQLSGGQRQRVALGRAMVRQPAVFLMDEPLSNLDAQLRVAMRAEIKSLHQRMRTTFVYVTHDQAEALTLADEIVVMNHGVVQQIGTAADIYDRPENLFVASFLGSPRINCFEGELVVDDGRVWFEGGDDVRLAFDGAMADSLARHAGKSVILGIRPEDVADPVGEAAGRSIYGRVNFMMPVGTDQLLSVRMRGSDAFFRVDKGRQFRSDEPVAFSVKQTRLHVFDKETTSSLLWAPKHRG